MFRLACALIIATLLVTIPMPARAQEISEQVLLNATFWINPPNEPSACILVEAGQLTVSARLSKAAVEQRPITMTLRGLMEDPRTNIILRVSEEETSTSTHVSGGRYCWEIAVDAPETANMANVQRGAYIVNVAARISYTPDR